MPSYLGENDAFISWAKHVGAIISATVQELKGQRVPSEIRPGDIEGYQCPVYQVSSTTVQNATDGRYLTAVLVRPFKCTMIWYGGLDH